MYLCEPGDRRLRGLILVQGRGLETPTGMATSTLQTSPISVISYVLEVRRRFQFPMAIQTAIASSIRPMCSTFPDTCLVVGHLL